MSNDKIARMEAQNRRLSADVAAMRVALARVDPVFRAARLKEHEPRIIVETRAHMTIVDVIGQVRGDGTYQKGDVSFGRCQIEYAFDARDAVRAALAELVKATGIECVAERVVSAVVEGRNEVIPL